MDTRNQLIRITDLLFAAAEKWPDKPAISFLGETQSWLRTKNRTVAAATLLKNIGVERGDRVAFLGLNSNVCFESYWSPALIGAIMVPINYRLADREMIECIQDCTPKVLIVDARFLKKAQKINEHCGSLTNIICCGGFDAPEGVLSYERAINDIIKSDTYAELCPSSNKETVIIFYTGGTTGKSKGVMLSHINFKYNTECSIPLYRMKQHWAFLIIGPLFHLAAGSRVFSSAALGGHAVILPKFDVVDLMESVEEYAINSATLVPTMYQMILEHPRFGEYDLSSLKMLASGAAPLSIALLSRIVSAFPETEFFQTYGMTEASPILTSLDSKYHVLEGPNSAKLGSVGRAVKHVDLIIADEDDNQLPANTVGQILARGENIMTGYWQLPQQTAEALKEGWYHTGDAGYLDEEGFLFLEGRVKDMIVSGGENIYPIEVENILEDHPAIHQCAVIGVPHETWGESVHAIVKLKDGAQVTERELIAFCKENIASYKCPVSVTFRESPMPLSPINKILKTELRKPFWEGRNSRLV
ncbi:MAG: acyl-CoA synthase [Gammaproteobacteria bacterium]|nr:acyl-CoA synthase [Gammaproteobacteria bacterium]